MLPWTMTRVKVHVHSHITQLKKTLIMRLRQKHPKHTALRPRVLIPQIPTCCHRTQKVLFTYDNYTRWSVPLKKKQVQLQGLWGSRELASSWMNYAAQVGYDLQDLKLGKPTAEGQRRSIMYIAQIRSSLYHPKKLSKVDCCIPSQFPLQYLFPRRKGL